MEVLMRFGLLRLIIAFIFALQVTSILLITAEEKNVNFIKNTSCSESYYQLCHHDVKCARVVQDNYFFPENINELHEIARKGMATRLSYGGPTILDINTGYIRDSNGLDNLFNRDEQFFSAKDFENYGNIIKKLKNLVSSTFGIDENSVYFTAPTFITRLDGNSTWEPQEIHDEYWHVHADMNNTAHYQFSGLLYLSTYNVDFTGDRTIEEVIEPMAGRVVIFSSGAENPHKVERVQSGQRYVLAFWFTCDSEKQFEIFLDGHAHVVFSSKVKSQLQRRQQQQQQQQQRTAKTAANEDL